PAVAAYEGEQGTGRGFAGHRTAGARAAHELLPDAADYEGGAAEHRPRQRAVADPRQLEPEQREQRARDRREEVASRVRERRPTPGDDWADSAQQHED